MRHVRARLARQLRRAVTITQPDVPDQRRVVAVRASDLAELLEDCEDETDSEEMNR